MHDLLIVKLHAYGFDMPSLKLGSSYVSNRKQTVKINDEFSSWEEAIFSVPQRSIIGPLLFNIFLYYLFLFFYCKLFTNYLLILQIMQMVIHPMPLKPQRVNLWNGWNNVLVIFLNGLKITE